jgi:hypothetical protein
MICSKEEYEYENNIALKIVLKMGEHSGSYMYYASTPVLFPSRTRIDSNSSTEQVTHNMRHLMSGSNDAM